MAAILGIDAAWTTTHPSGVALVSHSGWEWRCIALAPSYDAFADLASGGKVDWGKRNEGGPADASVLLGAARSLLNGHSVTIVSVDMPLATAPITNRREADDAVAREFGKNWCSPHTPSKVRPGPISDRFVKEFAENGFSLSVKGTTPGANQLVEVFPHPALLKLVKTDRRIPYKVSKATRYWKGEPLEARRQKLVAEFDRILTHLRSVISGIELPITKLREMKTLSALKACEDALDALVCAWAAIEYLQGRTKPYGDETAAIWIPV